MAQIQKYISIQELMDNLKRNPLLDDLVTLEGAVHYTVEFMRIMGMPQLFLEKTAEVQIEQYRGLLPCDYLEMIQVRNSKGRCIRYSTDSFHMSPRKRKDIPHTVGNHEDTYKVQGNCIFTTIESGLIEIAYQAIAVDKDGFPLLPDNASFTKALELYITQEYFRNLFYQGKISTAVLNEVSRNYAHYARQAQSDLVRPTIDQMEAITHMWNSIIPRVREHSTGFNTMGNQEYIRLQ